MLHSFLTANRQELLSRCVASMVQSGSPTAAPDITHGIPHFMDQLVEKLVIHSRADPSSDFQSDTEIGHAAADHGGELLRSGFSIEQVVHHYGDLCQAVTELAIEQGEKLTGEEFKILNRSLDLAIADSVGEYTRQRDETLERKTLQTWDERLGALAHELRNLLGAAALSLAAIKTGKVGITGAVGARLERSLGGMRDLIDRSLADVRLYAGTRDAHELIVVHEFIDDVRILAAIEATSKGIDLIVEPVDTDLMVQADRQLLSSATANLLQNAYKFTHAYGHTHTVLRVRATADRILIEIEDECGGLPEGKAEELFRPFIQRSRDRTGLGLGLSISKRAVEACDGRILVHDLPGKGCVFTIDLPRHLPSTPNGA